MGSAAIRINRVLAGDSAYDELSEHEQAIVRSVWKERVEQRIAELNLENEFTTAGRSWTDADEYGSIIRRTPRESGI